MYRRYLARSIVDALSDTPVVLLNGARQTGKTTLARQLIDASFLDHYLTLDDMTLLAAARQDPEAFIAHTRGRTVIDEVQRAPELFLALKKEVDRDRRPGRFLLTGSANALLLPKISGALVGRISIHTLGPLAQGEIERTSPSFLTHLMGGDTTSFMTGEGDSFTAGEGDEALSALARALRGGFPEALSRAGRPHRRQAWYDDYLTTLLQRDIHDIAQIEHMTLLPRLLGLLAARTAGLLNFANLAQDCGLAQSTLRRYLAHLQALFLIDLLPAWSPRVHRRFVRSPKIHFIDSGLVAHLIGASAMDPTHLMRGALIETFVYRELKRLVSACTTRLTHYHFRTHAGQEVDFVLEAADGSLFGVEVKSGHRVRADDFKGLRALRDVAGDRFRLGVMLYDGNHVAPFGDDFLALPMSVLWR